MTQWNDRTEADDGTGNQKDDRGDDDDDRNPDDASDSNDDDSDDMPPRSAPKKRVQARGSRSKRQSSTAAANYFNCSLQSVLHTLQEQDKSLPSKRERQSRLQPPFSLEFISPVMWAGCRDTPSVSSNISISLSCR
jgi:hypothetical protein